MNYEAEVRMRVDDYPPYMETSARSRFGSMPLLPPFEFEGVKLMVFPLKANISRLHEFCQSYLDINLTGPDADQTCVFRPAAPFVFMMVLHYDKMSSNETQTARNIGWISQHEITFTVPLEYWRWSGDKPGQGELKFQDWAIISPFIFVDDLISQVTGREVYGWPKVTGKLCADPNLLLHFPLDATPLLRFSSYTLPKYFQGGLTTQNLLLEVDYDPTPSYSIFPPDPFSPWAPWNVAANFTAASLSSLGDLFDLTSGLRLRGYPQQTDRLSFLLESSKVALGYASNAASGFVDPLSWMRSFFASQSHSKNVRRPGDNTHNLSVKNITVKQFPDIERPDLACYQALVESAMGIRRVNRAGILGDLNLSRGDLSGGCTIRLHHSTLHPIVETLGLAVHRVDSSPNEGSVSILKPILPYWSDVDLSYGLGQPIYAQTLPPQPTTQNDDRRYSYNYIIGSAAAPRMESVRIPDMLLRVYPIPACRKTLEAYVRSYNQLNIYYPAANGDGKQLQLDLHLVSGRAVVYLVCRDVDSNHGDVWADEETPDWPTDKSFQIYIPVRFPLAISRDPWVLRDEIVFISPYVYNNSARATISDHEVNGSPTQKATIKNSYDDPEGDMNYHPYVHTILSVESFASLGSDERAHSRRLIEIIPANTVDSESQKPAVKVIDANLSQRPARQRKIARQVGAAEEQKGTLKNTRSVRAGQGGPLRQLEWQEAKSIPEANTRGAQKYGPINVLGVKQYRASEDATLACYQALVARQTVIKAIRGAGTISNPVSVIFHKLASQPIVETLGLSIKESRYNAHTQAEMDVCETLSPFWLRVEAEERFGRNIASRSDRNTWRLHHQPESWAKSSKKEATPDHNQLIHNQPSHDQSSHDQSIDVFARLSVDCASINSSKTAG
jgi:hypothetical protein